MEAGSHGYTPAFFIGAAVFTLVCAPIALIVALMMLGGETDPDKRDSLRSWAWFSGIWTVVPAVLLIYLASHTFS